MKINLMYRSLLIYLFVIPILISFSDPVFSYKKQNNLADQNKNSDQKTKTQQNNKDNNQNKNKHIYPDNYYIGEVIITGRKIPNIEQSGTTTTIGSNEIKAHNDKTLEQVLSRIPGLVTYTHQKGHIRLKMRGFNQDKVVVLIDGIPLNNIYSTDIDLSAIPVINISKIIVTRGVSSALYGTDGASGTINIITKMPSKSFYGAELSYGNYNNVTVNMIHGAPIGNFYYLLSGTVLNSDGFEPSKKLDKKTKKEWFDKIIRYDLYPVSDPFGNPPLNSFDDVKLPAKNQYLNDKNAWDHNSYTKYHITAKTGYSLSKYFETGTSLGFYMYKGKTNSYQVNSYNSYRGDRWKPKYPYFGNSQEEVKKFAFRNRAFVWPYVYRLNVSPYIRGRFSNFQYKINMFFLNQGSKQNGFASLDHSIIKSKSLLLKYTNTYEPFYDYKTFISYGLRIFPSYKFSRWHRLNAAIHFRNEHYTGDEQAISKDLSPEIYNLKKSGTYSVESLSIEVLSLSIEDEIRLWDCLKIAAGISLDTQNFYEFKMRQNLKFENKYIVNDNSAFWGTRDSINPVIGMVYDPIKKYLRLRAAGALKTRFPTLSEYSKVENKEQDKNLKPERAYNLNGGIELFYLNKSISYRLDYFLNIIDNRIVKISKDDPPVNFDRVTSTGFETALTANFKRFKSFSSIYSSLSYTYVYARNKEFDKRNSNIKGQYLEFTPEHILNADLSFNYLKNININLWLNSNWGQRIYIMKNRPTEIDSEYSTDYFTTVKLNNPVFVNTKICYTLFDKYKVSTSLMNILDNYKADPFNPGPGRTFYINLSADFK